MTLKNPEATNDIPSEQSKEVTNFSKELMDFLGDKTISKKKTEIVKGLENEQLKNGLELFLTKQDTEEDKKNIENLKFALMTCEGDPIGVIAEHIGYNIGEIYNENSENHIVDYISITNNTGDMINDANNETKDNEKIEQIKEKQEATLELRKNLLKNHQDVDEKTRKKSEEVKKQLPEQTIRQLEERGYDENFIDNYILLKVTLNEVKGNPSFDKNQVIQFENSVDEISNLDVFLKNIDNECNIADTYLSSFSEKEIGQTRRELFNDKIGNKDLIDLKSSNINNRNRNKKYEMMFPEMEEEDMIVQYGKFLPNEFRWLLEDYTRQYEQNNLDEYKQSKEYSILMDSLKEIKNQMDEKTKDLMEELCIMSQIKGMYMCMGEGENFNLNKAKDIKNEDGVLTLKGHIDGVDFSLRQDTKDPNAHLQTSTKLKGDKINNKFSIGDNYKDSKFTLPSQDKIFNVAVESVRSDGALENATTPGEYVKLLQESFMRRVDKKYEDTKFVHHYMKEQVKGEKIVDSAIKTVEKIKGSKLNPTLDNVGSNEKLYDFLNLIDFNISHSSDAERRKLNTIMNKIEEITYLAKDKPNDFELNHYRPIIKDYLTGNVLGNTTKILNGNINDGGSMFDLFQRYKNPGDPRNDDKDKKLRMINLDYLYLDLIPVSTIEQYGGLNIPTTFSSPISGDYQENKKNPEERLKNELIS